MNDPIRVECEDCGCEFLTTFKQRDGRKTYCKKCFVERLRSGMETQWKYIFKNIEKEVKW